MVVVVVSGVLVAFVYFALGVVCQSLGLVCIHPFGQLVVSD